MENVAPLFAEGLQKLGLQLDAGVQAQLLAWATELLKWNRTFSLTAITRPAEVVDKHLLDSLAVAPEVTGAATLLDLGAGAGLPGIPLAAALPPLQATLIDAVAKKVAFMKAGAVKAGVASRVRALHVRVAGDPGAEGVTPADCVISRAFMDVGPFLKLARPYLAPGGRVVAMLGGPQAEQPLHAAAAEAGMTLTSQRAFTLPLSGDARAAAVFHVKQTP